MSVVVQRVIRAPCMLGVTSEGKQPLVLRDATANERREVYSIMSQRDQPDYDVQPPKPLTTVDGQLNPFPWYATMRETAPVRYDEHRNCWDVFRYEDVTRVLRDHETFSSQIDNTDPDTDPLAMQTTMILTDPPEHEHLRGIVEEFFKPGIVRELGSDIDRLATERLDAALADGDEMELVEDFAFAIPISTIAAMLGFPPDDQEMFREWHVKQVRAVDRPNTAEYLQETFREMRTYYEEAIADRRQQPRDDLLSAVIHADRDGTCLTENELIGFCHLLFHAGHNTTTILLTNAVWTFIEHDLIEALRTDTIALDTAIEEVLRYRSPVQVLLRKTATDVELHDTTIPAGERVAAWVGSANRDERQFDAPDTFRPERRPNPHIAFGAGIHFCLGAPLARLEADVALTAFLDRIQDATFSTESFDPLAPTTCSLERLPITVNTTGDAL